MAEKLKESCVLIPKTVTGEESVLYKTLLTRYKDRSLVNYFYSMALQPSVVNHLEGLGKKLVYGEVIAEDFINEYGLDKIISDHTTKKTSAEIAVGSVDSSLNVKEYDSALDIIDKVIEFNKNNKAFVANIVRRGGKFSIKVYERNASNQLSVATLEQERVLWNTIDGVMKAAGIDMEELHKEVPFLISPLTAHQIVDNLSRIKNASELKYLTASDIQMLLKLGDGSTQVERLKGRSGGGLDTTARYIYDALQFPKSVTADTMTLIEATLSKYREFPGVDLEALGNQVFSESIAFRSASEAYDINDTLRDLREKYPGLDDELIDLTNGIKSLRDAAGAAMLNLQRERNDIERKLGITDKSKELDAMEKNLAEAIRNKQYYIGMLDYMSRAREVSASINDIVANLSTSTDVLTRSRDNAKALVTMEEQIDEYLDVLQALASTSSESILVDDSLSADEQKVLRENATELVNFFRDKKERLGVLRKTIVHDLANEILGTAGFSQAAINDIVENEANRSSMVDWLYSVGRQSNPLIGVMGSIIRDAQDKRDRIMNPLIKRIDGALKRLEKDSGSADTSWMYDSSDMFLNPYNWDLYYAAMNAEKARLQKARGLSGAELAMAMQDWIEENTTDVVVDKENGRTEKMPNIDKFAKYRVLEGKDINAYYTSHGGKGKKAPMTWIANHLRELVDAGIIQIYNPVNELTTAQREYYDKMMQIKGELGSKLPAYAQSHYLPPQVTKDLQDNLAEGNIAGGFKNWAKDKFTISDKDQELNRNYFEIGEEKSSIVSGTLNGRVKKYIPLYYTRRLKAGEQGNLLKNASSAMAHLAGVAVGYECISEVEDVCNVLGDYIIDAVSIAKTSQDQDKMDGVTDNRTTIVQRLRDKYSSPNTRSIVEGMIDKHIYGYTLDEKEAKIAKGKLAKATKLALEFSSIYNLSTNLKGAVSNLLVGEYQMILDAMAGSMATVFGGGADFYTLTDYIWAHDLLFGKNSTTLIDLASNNTNSYNGLLAEIFDPTMDNFTEKSHKKYRSHFGNIIDKDWKFIGYGSGEHLIHYANMLAILHHEKVLVDGKETSLYDAFEVTEDVDGIKHMNVKAGTTTLDGQAVDEEYLNKVRGRIREANQNMHGSMNDEDQGIIKTRLLGRAAAHLRTWMFEHYSRRYRGSHYSAATKDQREGFYYTLFRCIKDMRTYHRGVAAQWDNLNNHQKTNVMRALSEMTAVIIGNILTWGGYLDPKEYESWLAKFTLYQVKRLLMDIKASTPVNAPSEGYQMIRNLFPLLTTLHKEYYLIEGAFNGDMFKTLQSGRHKGENKYWNGIKRRVLPFWHQIEEMVNLEEDDNIFTIFQMQYSM